VLDAATGKLIRRSQAFVPQQAMYTQPTADGVFMLPGANGGEEWSPIAVHPDLVYAYTVGLHQPMHYKCTTRRGKRAGSGSERVRPGPG